MFGIHVLEVGRCLSLKDKENGRELHAAYGNLLLHAGIHVLEVGR